MPASYKDDAVRGHRPAGRRTVARPICANWWTGLIAATREMENRAKAWKANCKHRPSRSTSCATSSDDVRKESLTDPLTGIANRKAFDMRCSRVGAGGPKSEPVSLLMCDIDHFKKFNDSWGHQTGDQVLRLVANCLSENVKGRDTAARYGGEEFGVLLRGTALSDAATHRRADPSRRWRAEKLVKKSTGDILGTITISIGVAQFGRRREGGYRRCAAPMPAYMAPSSWPQSGDPGKRSSDELN